MKDIYNNNITDAELYDAIENFANNNGYAGCDIYDVYKTAVFLNKENESSNLFIPRALIPIAFEAWWQLQHNVDSYGCDYEWVFDNEGMRSILIEDMQCDFNFWGETEEDFVEYFNLEV